MSSLFARAFGAIAAIAFLPFSGCSNSGGGGPVQLAPGVTLTGTFSVTSRVSTVQGPCTGVSVGQTNTSNSILSQSGNQITVDPGPGQFVGTLSGVVVRFVFSETNAGVTTNFDTTVTFNVQGTSFTGTSRESETVGGQQCVVTLSLSGTRVTPTPTPPPTPAGLATFFQGVSATGATATLRTTTAPTPGAGGPTVNATGPSSVVNGGTSSVQIAATVTVDAVAIYVQGIPGYYEVVLASAQLSVALVVQLGSAIPGTSFTCVYQARRNNVWGTPGTAPIAVTPSGTGALQVNLSWNSSADLDLHLVEPGGFEIFFAQDTSPSGGRLDVDGNAGCDASGTNENISYAGGSPPAGTYTVRVANFDECTSSSSNWIVRVNRASQVPLIVSNNFTGPGTGGGLGAGVVATTFNF